MIIEILEEDGGIAYEAEILINDEFSSVIAHFGWMF